MHLQIIVGSIREGRLALPVATWVEQVAAAHGPWTTELLDLKTWALPMFSLAKPPAMGAYEDELQLRWAKTISRGDAYIFVTPEYNHGYSAVLKNALDYLFAEWLRKPANFVSYGNVEGARGVEQLRLVLVELQMAPLRSALHLRDMHSKLKQGKFEGSEEDKRQLIRGLEDLHWWAHALHAARASHTARPLA
jgi:NAD(P)H-dependent FMN reductase